MKVWVYVEGESDRLALNALWEGWRNALRLEGWGLQVVPIDTKHKFLRKVGARAAEKLAADERDLVVGLPDFYPNAPYANTESKHETVEELGQVQRKAVESSLMKIYGIVGVRLTKAMERFCASALKHDMEMLLLAAREELRTLVGTQDQLGNWRTPVEEQNQQKPPKRIVEGVFQTKTAKKRAYRDTKDAPAVLRKIKSIRDILFLADGRDNCPVFKSVLDWIGQKTRVRAYE